MAVILVLSDHISIEWGVGVGMLACMRVWGYPCVCENHLCVRSVYVYTHVCENHLCERSVYVYIHVCVKIICVPGPNVRGVCTCLCTFIQKYAYMY